MPIEWSVDCMPILYLNYGDICIQQLFRSHAVSVHIFRSFPTYPFTDWQNDLHLISGIDYGKYLRQLSDLATLIAAATSIFPGAVSIGSSEDRNGYVCCRVPH